MLRRIYLETNSMRQRWPVIRGELRDVMILARTVGAQVCVPTSAIIEHRHTTVREWGERVDKATAAVNEINGLLRGVARDQHVPQRQDIDEVFAAYDRAVQIANQTFEFSTIPVTQRTVAEFVRFAAERVPPFKSEDAGFRDAVHIHSIIEHLSAYPLQAVATAVLVSADKRLSKADVVTLIQRAGVSLDVVDGFRPVREQLIAQLGEPTREKLAAFSQAWRPHLMLDAQTRLLPRVLQALPGLRLPSPKYRPQPGSSTETTVNSVLFGSFAWEDPPVITPAGAESPNSYHASFELRLQVSAAVSWQSDYLPGERTTSYVLSPTLLLGVEAAVDFLQDAGLRITYEECYAFCVFWTRDDGENLPGRLPLLAEPL